MANDPLDLDDIRKRVPQLRKEAARYLSRYKQAKTMSDGAASLKRRQHRFEQAADDITALLGRVRELTICENLDKDKLVEEIGIQIERTEAAEAEVERRDNLLDGRANTITRLQLHVQNAEARVEATEVEVEKLRAAIQKTCGQNTMNCPGFKDVLDALTALVAYVEDTSEIIMQEGTVMGKAREALKGPE